MSRVINQPKYIHRLIFYSFIFPVMILYSQNIGKKKDYDYFKEIGNITAIHNHQKNIQTLQPLANIYWDLWHIYESGFISALYLQEANYRYYHEHPDKAKKERGCLPLYRYFLAQNYILQGKLSEADKIFDKIPSVHLLYHRAQILKARRQYINLSSDDPDYYLLLTFAPNKANTGQVRSIINSYTKMEKDIKLIRQLDVFEVAIKIGIAEDLIPLFSKKIVPDFVFEVKVSGMTDSYKFYDIRFLKVAAAVFKAAYLKTTREMLVLLPYSDPTRNIYYSWLKWYEQDYVIAGKSFSKSQYDINKYYTGKLLKYQKERFAVLAELCNDISTKQYNSAYCILPSSKTGSDLYTSMIYNYYYSTVMQKPEIRKFFNLIKKDLSSFYTINLPADPNDRTVLLENIHFMIQYFAFNKQPKIADSLLLRIKDYTGGYNIKYMYNKFEAKQIALELFCLLPSVLADQKPEHKLISDAYSELIHFPVSACLADMMNLKMKIEQEGKQISTNN